MIYDNNLFEQTIIFLKNDLIIKNDNFIIAKKKLLFDLNNNNLTNITKINEIFFNFNDSLHKLYIICYKIYHQLFILNIMIKKYEINISIEYFIFNKQFANNMYQLSIYLTNILLYLNNIEIIFNNIISECKNIELIINTNYYKNFLILCFDFYLIIKNKKIFQLDIINEIKYIKNIIKKINDINKNINNICLETIQKNILTNKQKQKQKILFIILIILLILLFIILFLKYILHIF